MRNFHYELKKGLVPKEYIQNITNIIHFHEAILWKDKDALAISELVKLIAESKEYLTSNITDNYYQVEYCRFFELLEIIGFLRNKYSEDEFVYEFATRIILEMKDELSQIKNASSKALEVCYMHEIEITGAIFVAYVLEDASLLKRAFIKDKKEIIETLLLLEKRREEEVSNKNYLEMIESCKDHFFKDSFIKVDARNNIVKKILTGKISNHSSQKFLNELDALIQTMEQENFLQTQGSKPHPEGRG